MGNQVNVPITHDGWKYRYTVEYKGNDEIVTVRPDRDRMLRVLTPIEDNADKNIMLKQCTIEIVETIQKLREVIADIEIRECKPNDMRMGLTLWDDHGHNLVVYDIMTQRNNREIDTESIERVIRMHLGYFIDDSYDGELRVGTEIFYVVEARMLLHGHDGEVL